MAMAKLMLVLMVSQVATHAFSKFMYACMSKYIQLEHMRSSILLLPSYKTRKEHYVLLLNCAKVAAAPKDSVGHADGDEDDPDRKPWQGI